jgi:hypothetical protein
MVAKSPSRFRQIRILLAIALALLAPITVIYINYVSDQRTFFTSRSFRQLGVIGRQIWSRIDTLKPILSSIVDGVDNDVDTPGDSPVTPSVRVKQVEDKAAEVSENGPSPRFSLTAKPTLTEEPESKPGTLKFNVTITEVGSPARILINYDYRPDGSKHHYYLKAAVSMDELAGQYLDTAGQGEGPVFDQVVIALRSSGAVLFQNGKPGLSASNLYQMDGLAAAGKQAPADLASSNGFSGLYDVTVAGEPYKLLMEPFGSLLNGKGEPDQFLVCGLIQARQFNQATSAVPPTVLIIVIFLFLALTLAWPFIQLGLMGPDNRFRIYDVVFVAFSTVVGAGLLALVVLDIYAYLRIQGVQDCQLSGLSDEISRNLSNDLCDAVGAMDALGSTRLISDEIDELSRPGQQVQAEPPRHYDRESVFVDDKAPPDPHELYKQLKEKLLGCPFFDTVFWADQDGWQRISLTSGNYIFPQVRIKDRDYFMKVTAGDGWPLCGPGSLTYVQPVIARNSGKSLAAVARRTAGKSGWVTVLGARLSSIMDTAIPDGFGFCIINHDGSVLFHSDERRNLQENLFEECDESGELRSIVDSRTEAYLDTRYVGRSHRLYVRSLPSMPWSLIVFRDKSILTSANLDLLTVSVSLLFIHCIILVALLYAVCPLHSKKRSKWVWPFEHAPRKYRAVMVVNLALSAILYGFIIWTDGLTLLLAASILPILGLLTASVIVAETWRIVAKAYRMVAEKWRKFAGRRGSTAAPQDSRQGSLEGRPETANPPESIKSDGPKQLPQAQGKNTSTIQGLLLRPLMRWLRSRLNTKRGYALAGATTVLLLSVLPATAGFKLAHNRQVELLVRFYQVSFVKNLNRRSHLFDERQRLAGSQTSSVPIGGNYYSRFFTDKPPDYSVPQPPHTGELSGFDGFMSSLYRHVNQDLYFRGLQDHFLTIDSSAPGTPNLEFVVTDERALQQSTRGSEQLALEFLQTANQPVLLHLHSQVPLLGRPGGAIWVAGSFLLLALILAGLYLVVRIISRRVFLIDLKEGYGYPGQEPNRMLALQNLAENLLVLAGRAAATLVPPEWWQPEAIRVAQPSPSIAGNGASRGAATIPLPAGWQVVGGAECSDEAWRSEYNYDRKIAEGINTIVIDNFDYKMEDPDANRGKVDFLRELWARRLRTIVISRVNPVYFPINSRTSDEAPRSSNGDASPNGSNHHSVSPDEFWDDVFSSSIKVHIEPVDPDTVSDGGVSKRLKSPAASSNRDQKTKLDHATKLDQAPKLDHALNLDRPHANTSTPNAVSGPEATGADSLQPSTSPTAVVSIATGATPARLQTADSPTDGTSSAPPLAGHAGSPDSASSPSDASSLSDAASPSDAASLDNDPAQASNSGLMTQDSSPSSSWLTPVPGSRGPSRLLRESLEFTDVSYEKMLDYRAIWRTLSRVERVTLFYICHDRFVSCKNTSVQDLLRRGLIRRDPALCPMSKDFKKFVISAIEPEEIYSGEAGVSTWNALRAPMMAALALALIFLFYTQRSMLDSGLAVAAALTVAIPALLRLVSILQRGKPATAPDAGESQD